MLQSIFNLQNKRSALIITPLNPLSKVSALLRWIKHPQQSKRPTRNRLHIRIPACTVFVNHRGTDWEPKKKPQLRVLLALTHCFAATQSTFSNLKEKANNMVYKFLIARRSATLAQINSIRFITVQAPTEQLARSKYSNLPLVFVSCTQQGVAA